MDTEIEKSTSTPSDKLDACVGEGDQEKSDSITLPSHVAGSGTVDQLVETARSYAKQAASENTLKAYAKDWAHFTRWCRLKGTDPLPPSPEMIGLYLANLAAPTGKAPALSVSTIDRRLSGLGWNYTQRGFTLDRKNRHIASVLAGIKRRHARPPVRKEAIMADDILAMVGSLPFDLRGLRDRAILLLGYAGVCADPKSSASTCTRTTRRILVAGLRSSTKAPCSRSTRRPAGARSRLAAAPAIKPARSRRWNNGCTLQRSTSALSSSAPRGMASAHLKHA